MKNQIPLALLATSLAAATAFATGCGGNPPAQAPIPATLASSSLLEDRGGVPDAQIERVLRRELQSDPSLWNQKVSVDSARGIVTLWGTVSSQWAKVRAVELSHVVRGVRALVDRLSVNPYSRPDSELEFVVARVLSRDPVTAGQRIGARAREQIVTLTGEVGSNAARRIAEQDVLAIPGVRDVVDDLAVQRGPRQSEPLRAEVERMVSDDPWLDGSHVRVKTKDGLVRLEGYVGSAAERARAENDAWAASPRGVDASGLRVEAFAKGGTLRDQPPAPRSDRDLRESLLAAYIRDPRVHPFVPSTDIRNGIVVLTGVAPNSAVARAAAEDARNMPGVTDVRDDIKDAPTVLAESDASVDREVRSAIARDPRLASLGLEVRVNRGRVTLTGTVPSESDRLHAIALASSAAGARDVEDGLVLAPTLGVTSPQP